MLISGSPYYSSHIVESCSPGYGAPGQMQPRTVGFRLPRVRLRTKFLLSLLLVSAGLTTGTLLIVRDAVEKRVRESIREDLRNSCPHLRSFDRQRDATLSRAANLLANLPNDRALMTTRDKVTIQDGSEDVWRRSASDVLVLADARGQVDALRSSSTDLEAGTAEALLQHSLQAGNARDWWFGGGHLYQIWIQPIYFGREADNNVLGYLAVGHEVDSRAAKDFGTVASSEVAFESGSTLVASTFAAPQQLELARRLSGASSKEAAGGQEIQLGNEHYLATTVALSVKTDPRVSLTVLKSLDQATAFLAGLNSLLVALGLLSLAVGSALVFIISHTFTQPLENLVAGVRALERGDYTYPLKGRSGDEVAEVTQAFDRMRQNLQHGQDEHQELEDRLRQAHKMESVGRLAGGVAHDFNNLLTIIHGHTDLLLDKENLDDFVRRSVEQIQKAGDRAVVMTRQLLAFSRMQVLQSRVLDLNTVVNEIGKMLPRLIGEHIEYEFIPGDELQSIKADPGQIEQAIMNLAVNARDAMPEGGKLTIRTSNVALSRADTAQRAPMAPGLYVLLSVSDTGQGMDEKTVQHIFEPFFTTKEIGKGTGLGLATVYGVVKQSGGFIWVDSAPGKGTTFEVYLPQVSESAQSVDSTYVPAAQFRGTETLLVVEDEVGVRGLACRFLKASGYRVLEAADGMEALQIASQYEDAIHLILTDVVMPRLGGKALAEQVRMRRPSIKILFMSGYTEYTSNANGELSALGPALQKPFTRLSLTAKVREVLSGVPVHEADGTIAARIL